MVIKQMSEENFASIDEAIFRSLDSYTYVPDDIFEQHLIDLGFDDVLDDYVLTNNMNGIEVLILDNYGISDLTGIEDMSNLRANTAVTRSAWTHHRRYALGLCLLRPRDGDDL